MFPHFSLWGSLALLSTAPLMPIHGAPWPVQEATPRAGQREQISLDVRYRSHRLLAEPLLEPLAAVHRLEERYVELGLYTKSGKISRILPQPNSKGYAFLMGEEPDLFPGLAAFNFGYRKDMKISVKLEQILECGLYEAAHKTALLALEKHPDLEPQQILAAFSDEFVSAAPICQLPKAEELWGQGLLQQRLPLLCNGAIGYVGWAFLHLDEYWKNREPEREAFISSLIEQGSQSVLLGWTVRRALQPPLSRTAECPGFGIAMDMDSQRGPVGFTETHEEQVGLILNHLYQLRQASGVGPLPGMRPDGARSATNDALSQRSAWADELAQWIKRELYPNSLSIQMARGKSLEQRLEYWRSLAERLAYAEFKLEVLAEIRAMLADQDDWPQGPRLNELLALKAQGTLTPDQTRELDALQTEVFTTRSTLIHEMDSLLVQSGAEGFFADVAATLGREIPGLLQGSEFAPGLDGLMSMSSVLLSAYPNPEALFVLDRHLTEPDQRLPTGLIGNLLTMAPIHGLPGFEKVLTRTLGSGTAMERGYAIANSSWMQRDQYLAELTRLMNDCRDSKAAPDSRGMVRDLAVSSLWYRQDGAQREGLLKSLQDGLWANPTDWASWARANESHRTGLLSKLTPEEKENFVKQGLLPASLAN